MEVRQGLEIFLEQKYVVHRNCIPLTVHNIFAYIDLFCVTVKDLTIYYLNYLSRRNQDLEQQGGNLSTVISQV